MKTDVTSTHLILGCISFYSGSFVLVEFFFLLPAAGCCYTYFYSSSTLDFFRFFFLLFSLRMKQYKLLLWDVFNLFGFEFWFFVALGFSDEYPSSFGQHGWIFPATYNLIDFIEHFELWYGYVLFNAYMFYVSNLDVIGYRNPQLTKIIFTPSIERILFPSTLRCSADISW